MAKEGAVFQNRLQAEAAILIDLKKTHSHNKIIRGQNKHEGKLEQSFKNPNELFS